MIDVLKRINDLRAARGWTIYKLAEESMVAQSTMSNMFTRKTLPSLFTLNQICDAFGITMSEFFTDGVEISEETKLLSVFRELDEKDRKTILSLAEVLRKNKETNENRQ